MGQAQRELHREAIRKGAGQREGHQAVGAGLHVAAALPLHDLEVAGHELPAAGEVAHPVRLEVVHEEDLLAGHEVPVGPGALAGPNDGDLRRLVAVGDRLTRCIHDHLAPVVHVGHGASLLFGPLDARQVVEGAAHHVRDPGLDLAGHLALGGIRRGIAEAPQDLAVGGLGKGHGQPDCGSDQNQGVSGDAHG
jgi:hypothetical protein